MKEKQKNVACVVVLLFALSIFKMRTLAYEPPMQNNEIAAWKAAYDMLDQYAARGEILVSPHLSSYCMDRGIDTFDYGQAEFCNSSSLSFCIKNRMWSFLFDDPGFVIKRYVAYSEQIYSKMKNMDYSLIALTTYGNYGLSEQALERAGYGLLSVQTLVTGNQNWVTYFYTPKEEYNSCNYYKQDNGN